MSQVWVTYRILGGRPAAIFVQRVLVNSAIEIDHVHTSHVDDVQAENGAWHSWERNVDVQVKLSGIKLAKALTNWSSSD